MGTLTHPLDATLVSRIQRSDFSEPFPRGPHIPAHLLEDEHCLRFRPYEFFRGAGEGVFVRKRGGHEGEETSECESCRGEENEEQAAGLSVEGGWGMGSKWR